MNRFVCIALLVAGIGCGGSGGDAPAGGGGSTHTQLGSLAIADATTLFITSSVASAALPNSAVTQVTGPKLYKITADNQVLEVTQTCVEYDDQGVKVREFPCATSYAPTAIYDAGPDYVYIAFGGEQVLARKSDGAVFLTTPLGVAAPMGGSNVVIGATTIQADAGGNVYWRTGRGPDYHVVKVTADGSSATGTQITPDPHVVMEFLVNGSGDVWYGSPARIRFASTAGFAVPPSYVPWVGSDGQFYGLGIDPSVAPGPIMSDRTWRIVRLRIDGTSIAEEPVSSGFVLPMLASLAYPARAYQLGGRTLIALGMTASTMLEVQDPAHPVVHDAPCIRPTFGVASTEAIWDLASGSGGLSLTRWSPTSGCTTVLSSGQLDILSFTVGANDVALFQALRMSDGRKILASVTASGTVTVLDEGVQAPVLSLQRIR